MFLMWVATLVLEFSTCFHGHKGIILKRQNYINTEIHYGKHIINSEVRMVYFKCNIKKKKYSWKLYDSAWVLCKIGQIKR